MTLDNVRIPHSQVLGEVGKGYKYAIESLNIGRIGIGAQVSILCVTYTINVSDPVVSMICVHSKLVYIHVQELKQRFKNNICSFVSKNEHIFEGLHVFLSMLLLP